MKDERIARWKRRKSGNKHHPYNGMCAGNPRYSGKGCWRESYRKCGFRPGPGQAQA